jgi:hypothetical protein
MFYSRIRKITAMILVVSLTLSFFSWQNLGLKASAVITPGTSTFTTTDENGTNMGTSITRNGLDIYNASSLDNAHTGITTGSFVCCTSTLLGMTKSGITPIDLTSGTFVSPSVEPPKYMVIKSDDGTAFSFQSIYACDNQTCYNSSDQDGSPYEKTLIFEGFLNGKSTGTVTRSFPENDSYTTFESTPDFDFSSDSAPSTRSPTSARATC